MAEINPHRLKISQLRALVAIAATGTFGKAAIALDLSQSAVSHAIATLEEELGVMLFYRGRQGALLTSVGERVAESAQTVLDALETIGQTAKQARGIEVGDVRIGCFRSAATHILPQVLGTFQQQHPKVRVTITEYVTTSDIEADIGAGKLDIGLVVLPTGLDSTKLHCWELMRDRYLALLPPTEPPLRQITWEQLEQYSLILAPRHVTCCQIVHDYFQKFDRPFNLGYEITEDSTILSMVMQGLGATIMAQLAAEPMPSGIRAVPLPEPLERVIGIAISAVAMHPPVVYAFLDLLKKTAQPAQQKFSAA